jgi:hypothetical protein
VLATRRLHALGSFLFGSVGQAVTSASSCPVVVVRGVGTALLGSVSQGCRIGRCGRWLLSQSAIVRDARPEQDLAR